jgi:hypothetical protein
MDSIAEPQTQYRVLRTTTASGEDGQSGEAGDDPNSDPCKGTFGGVKYEFYALFLV